MATFSATARASCLAALVALAPAVALALTPAGPTPGRFMWQGMQREFVRADGTPCVGRVALAVGQDAVCYTAADDSLRCAGWVYREDFGPTFTATSQTGVEQILISPTKGIELLGGGPWFAWLFGTRNGLCVKKTDGSVWCLGAHNDDGQFGDGSTSSRTSFTRWGCESDLVAIGTGNWEQICALDARGRVRCAGETFGSSPVDQPGAGHGSFWIDPNGTVHVDDPETLRVSNGVSDCRIRPRNTSPFVRPRFDDLACFGHVPWRLGSGDLWTPSLTLPLIVDGGVFGSDDPESDELLPGLRFTPCWLTVRGEVMCTIMPGGSTGVKSYFEGAGRPALAFAADPHSSAMCAVMDDGSLWCLGGNSSGKLGTGAYDDLDEETQVQPPGSVRIACESPPPISPTTTLSPPAPTTTTTVPPGSCPCPGFSRLSLTTRKAAGICGTARTGTGALLRELQCGGNYFGGGGNSIPLPLVQPDGAGLLFDVSSCTPSGGLTLGPTTAAEDSRRCTSAGCMFGTPIALPNPLSTPTSSCIVQRLTASVSGFANCATGDVATILPLSHTIYLTGDMRTSDPGIQACPICAPSVGNETCPGDRCAPCCHGGANHLKPCTPSTAAPGDAALNAAYPTSPDCLPEEKANVGTLPVSFSLATSPLTWTAPTNGPRTGVFAGYCRDADGTGSFQNPAVACFRNGMVTATCSGVYEGCEQRDRGAFGPNAGHVRSIQVIGTPAGSFTVGNVGSGTLAALFGIPPTFDATVDAAANLPGPGAVTMPVDLQLHP